MNGPSRIPKKDECKDTTAHAEIKSIAALTTHIPVEVVAEPTTPAVAQGPPKIVRQVLCARK